MMEGVFDLMPSAKVSTEGFYRDEKTLQPVQYYVKLANNIQERTAYGHGNWWNEFFCRSFYC